MDGWETRKKSLEVSVPHRVHLGTPCFVSRGMILLPPSTSKFVALAEVISVQPPCAATFLLVQLARCRCVCLYHPSICKCQKCAALGFLGACAWQFGSNLWVGGLSRSASLVPAWVGVVTGVFLVCGWVIRFRRLCVDSISIFNWRLLSNSAFIRCCNALFSTLSGSLLGRRVACRFRGDALGRTTAGGRFKG